MATLVFFHAHPDDEAISTGGTMALAARSGHRVVLVVATKGEEGLVPEGFLDSRETLSSRRVAETMISAEILGVKRVEFLGYRDSGMMGWAQNDNPECFWKANVDSAADRLKTILAEECADVVTVYDDHGGYGHPDHIQVHRVGHLAAELAETPRVYEATMRRESIKAVSRSVWTGDNLSDDVIDHLGTPESDLSAAIDVREILDCKRAAMAAHASQITKESWILRLPEDLFSAAFGTEWYRRTRPTFTGRIPSDRDTSLF